VLTIIIVGGDSGAWVISNDDGRVCGHVLAWCSRNRWAYIIPMEVTVADIEATLGASVRLPGSKVVIDEEELAALHAHEAQEQAAQLALEQRLREQQQEVEQHQVSLPGLAEAMGDITLHDVQGEQTHEIMRSTAHDSENESVGEVEEEHEDEVFSGGQSDSDKTDASSISNRGRRKLGKGKTQGGLPTAEPESLNDI
jgi:hypothetical protein